MKTTLTYLLTTHIAKRKKGNDCCYILLKWQGLIVRTVSYPRKKLKLVKRFSVIIEIFAFCKARRANSQEREWIKANKTMFLLYLRKPYWYKSLQPWKASLSKSGLFIWREVDWKQTLKIMSFKTRYLSLTSSCQTSRQRYTTVIHTWSVPRRVCLKTNRVLKNKTSAPLLSCRL